MNAHCEVMSVYKPSGSAGNAPIKCHQADKEPQWIELSGHHPEVLAVSNLIYSPQ